MLRRTLPFLAGPATGGNNRNYTHLRTDKDRRGRLSVEAVAEELNESVEYTRALLLPWRASYRGPNFYKDQYPSEEGRSSRPGATSQNKKLFPLYQPRKEIRKGLTMPVSRMNSN